MKSSINETDWSLGTGEREVCREAEGEIHAWMMEEWKKPSLLSCSVNELKRVIESIAWYGKVKKLSMKTERKFDFISKK